MPESPLSESHLPQSPLPERSPATVQTMLDERYGRRAGTRRTRTALGVVIAVVAAAVIWFGWATVTNPDNGVRADGTAFQLTEHTATVEFQLTAPIGSTVACAIEALDEEYGVVGWKIVEYEASDTHTRAFSETIPLVSEATTGLVNACWVT